jgi:hypothetical protein
MIWPFLEANLVSPTLESVGMWRGESANTRLDLPKKRSGRITAFQTCSPFMNRSWVNPGVKVVHAVEEYINNN